MMYKQGDIILVPFPYNDDFSQSKKRPAIIVSNDKTNVKGYIVVKVTTVISNSQFSYPIFERDTDIKFDRPSEVRINEIMTIAESLIIKKINRLKKDSLIKLVDMIYENFDYET